MSSLDRVARAADATSISLTGTHLTLVVVVAAIAVVALVMGVTFRRQVLAADPGTAGMQEIGNAVEEGAQAYLARQFKTLSVFVVIVFVLLLALPADTAGVRWALGFFVLGAVFSAAIGYLGMSLAVKANVRVASAARGGSREDGMRIAFRTGGTVGMATVGLGLLGRLRGRAPLPGRRARRSSRASASARPCWRCSCGSAAASSPRPPTWAPTSSARSRRASPRTTPATRPRSPTTWATTSATAPAWPPTCSSPTRSLSSPPSSWARRRSVSRAWSSR